MAQYPELGRLLKRARLAGTQTQADVARAARIHLNYYGHIERGNRHPTPAVLARIATVVGADYLALARAAGFAPQSIGEFTVAADSLEKAAWLRLFGARFDVDELEQLYRFALQWGPRTVEHAEATEHQRTA